MTEKIKDKHKILKLWQIQNFSNIILNHHKEYDSNTNFKNENLLQSFASLTSEACDRLGNRPDKFALRAKQLLFNYMDNNKIPQGLIFNLVKTKIKKIDVNDLNEFISNNQDQTMNFYRGFNFYVSKNKFASEYEKNPTIQYGGGNLL